MVRLKLPYSLKPVGVLLILCSLVIALTPYYGVGYLLMILATLQLINFSAIFSSLFGRLILASLLLAGSSMVTGIGCWVMSWPLIPLIVLLLYLAIVAILYQRKKPVERPPYFSKSDIVSIGIAAVAPAIIFVSFYLPNPSNAASYQFVSNGWDNGSHYNMIQSDAKANGYVYGPEDVAKYDPTGRSTAYPQGWHLSVMTMANGFAGNLFDENRPMVAINTYIFFVLLWYFATAFVICKTSWYFLQTLTKRTKSRLDTVLFVLFQLALGSILLYDTLMRGFPNYLACMLYLVLMAGAGMELLFNKDKSASTAHYLIMLLSGTIAGLIWLAPLPAACFTVLSGLFILFKRYHSRVNKHLILVFLVSLLALCIALFQAYIFVHFSDNAASQVNAGSAGASITINLAVLGFATIIVFFSLVNLQKSSDPLYQKLYSSALITLTPILLLTAFVYAYQFLTVGSPSYYAAKMGGLYLACLSVFLIPLATYHTRQTLLQLSSVHIVSRVATYGALIAAFYFIFSSIPSGIPRLFQSQSRVSYEVAQEVVKYIEHQDPDKTKIIIYTGNSKQDRNGDFVGKAGDRKLTCTREILTKNNVKDKPASRSGRILDCANKLSDYDIIVITTDKTDAIIRAIPATNLHPINVQD